MADEKQPQPQRSPLDEKISQVLSDRVILKPLTRWNEAYKEFPRFVMEYLVSRYVDAAAPVAGQHKIDKILTEHYSESAKKELIKSRIKERGQYTLLGQLTVRLDQARNHYWASVPALGTTPSCLAESSGPIRRCAADQWRLGHDGDRVRRHLRNQRDAILSTSASLHHCNTRG